MEENVIVLKYNQQTSNAEDLFVSFPNDNEVAYCRQSDKSIFVLNGTDMSKAQQIKDQIDMDLSNGSLNATETASDLYAQGLQIVVAKRSVRTGALILS